MQQTQQVSENLCVASGVQEISVHAQDIGSGRSSPLGPSAVLLDARHAIWICAFIPACFHPNYDHPRCGPNGECPSGLTCSPQSICEGGANATDDAGINQIIDSPPDALICYGTSIVKICLASAPTQPLVISNLTTIDTMTSPMCVATVSGGANYCVLAATSIMINATLRATGPKPLVLIASDSITVSQLIDVGSHRTTPEFTGAGADPATCVAGIPAGTRGGGAGGSFTGKGGRGGNGAGGGAGGQAANGTTTITELQGGCPGQSGDGGGKGTGGHGGGAVYLIAVNRIDITGPGINAAGEGGDSGKGGPVAAPISSGAGGGGAGGMIGFDSPTITCASLLLANGGAGGEGSGVTIDGAPGGDPSTTAAAPGGTGNSAIGGDGGNGSSGAAAGPGANGLNGSSIMANDGGGGGGGGGAGLLKGPAASLGNNVSPAVTP